MHTHICIRPLLYKGQNEKSGGHKAVPGTERERAQTTSAFIVMSHCGAPVSEQWMGRLGGLGDSTRGQGPTRQLLEKS